MVQTLLFNSNATDNESLEQHELKTQPSFEQSSTIDHPLDSVNNGIFVLNEIKHVENNKDDPFDLILIDLKNTDMNEIKCVKKNIYSKEDVNFIAISYHPNGELKDQPFKTPNHVAHITSIDLKHLDVLLYYIKNETDLKNIQYVWLDAISLPLDQQQQQQQQQQLQQQKERDLLNRSEIYKRATCILAVPDLNRGYLKQNPANRMVFNLIKKYKRTIYKEILRHQQQQHSLSNMKNQLKKWKSKNDLKKIYQFLAYLIYEWSNNPMVINEYHIAKEKNIPLKYMFISLLVGAPIMEINAFFSYNFNNNDHSNQQQQQSKKTPEQQKYSIHQYTNNRNYSRVDYLKKIINDLKVKIIKRQHKIKHHHHQQQQNKMNNNINNYLLVDNHKKFLHFLDIRLTQRHYLDIILNANTTNQHHQNRFDQVLPTLEKYRYLFQDSHNSNNESDESENDQQNNHSIDWNITDMTTVRLKLYEIMDHKIKDNNDKHNAHDDDNDDNLWDKAGLLYACAQSKHKAIILPSFASFDTGNIYIPEIYNIEMAHKTYLGILDSYEMKINTNTKNVKHYLKKYKITVGNLYSKNLTSIHLNHNDSAQPYLAVKSNIYFISKLDCKLFDSHFLTSCSLNNDHHLRLVFIPFYVFNIPDYVDVPPMEGGSGAYLFGNMHQNRWVVININLYTDYLAPYLPYSLDYTFNIY
ncbi:unnamed protein product [Cunninghamella blakesleeana]